MKGFFEYFSLSKGERIGFITLILLLTVIIGGQQFLNRWIETVYRADTGQISKEAERYREALARKDSLKQLEQEQSPEKAKNTATKEEQQEDTIEVNYFPFNPNKIAFKKWRKLGVSAKVAHTIDNYLEQGGEFSYKQDLKEIYGLSDQKYQQLEPWIQLPEQKEISAKSEEFGTSSSKEASNEKEAKPDTSSKPKQVQTVEINNADSIGLMQVYGIGPVFAKRILAYRADLGGFLKLEQLKEVYGVDDEYYDQLAEQLYVDSTAINRLSVKDAEFKALLKHPYLSYPDVLAIVKYRENQDQINGVQDLSEHRIIGQKVYKQIKPYLKL